MENIFDKISEIEKQLEEYKKRRQDQLDIFLLRNGVNDFISETNSGIAYLQGQIDILKKLLDQKVESD